MSVVTAAQTKIREGKEALQAAQQGAVRQRLTALRERALRVVAFFRSTPRRTFILYPLLVLLAEIVERRGRLRFNRRGLLVMLWGFLQFRMAGSYRRGQGAGSTGFGSGNMPDVVVEDGPYAFTRNPMYLGHLIYLFGVATFFRSKTGDLVLMANALWFHRRVLKDERLLRKKFGAQYAEYSRRVKRWVPYLL
jgi:hypothetical protein